MTRAQPVRFGRACRFWLIGVLPTRPLLPAPTKIAAAFEVTYSQMCRRIESLLAPSDLNETSLQAALAEIGDLD